MGVLADEGGGAAVEVELLGEVGQEGKRNDGVFGVGEDEVLDGENFEEVFVGVHEFLESWVSGSGGDVLSRGGFGAELELGLILGGGGDEDGEGFQQLGRHGNGKWKVVLD